MKRLVISLVIVAAVLVGVICGRNKVDKGIDQTVALIQEIQHADASERQALSDQLGAHWERCEAMFYAWYPHNDVKEVQAELLMIRYYTATGDADELTESAIKALMLLRNIRRSEDLRPENVF
ncbi:MAG: DUF4363 family protein [Clostridia bacterium]|nr:DUF4363 family protein [Clostridia bacterium]